MIVKPVIAAIDCGTGYTKWAVRDSCGQLRTGSFISIAPSYADIGYCTSRQVARVDVDGLKLIAGPGCISFYDPFIQHRESAWSRLPRTRAALIKYALAAMGEEVIHHLILGTPECCELDLVSYQGTNAVPVLADNGETTRKIKVELVSIVNATTAALLGAAIREPKLLDDSEDVLELQLGYSSLVFKAPDDAYTRRGAVMGGMMRVYDQLNRHFWRDPDARDPIPHVRLELAQQGTRDLRWYGRELDFHATLPLALPVLDHYLDEVARLIGPGTAVRKVVVTGGAAPLLAARVRRYPSLPEPFVPQEPQFASVLGYLATILGPSNVREAINMR